MFKRLRASMGSFYDPPRQVLAPQLCDFTITVGACWATRGQLGPGGKRHDLG